MNEGLVGGGGETGLPVRPEGNDMGEQLIDFESHGTPARVSDSTYNAAFTVSLPITLPKGKYARGLLLDIDVTPTATGTGTAYLAEMVKKVTVSNEDGKKVMELDGKAGLGAAAVLFAILQGITQTVFGKNVVAASATSYNSWFYFAQAMNGQKFTITVEFLSPAAALTGLTVTACATTVGAVIMVSDEPGEPVESVANELASATRYDEDDALAYFIAADNSELSSIVSSISIDDQTLSAEQLKALENATAMREVGLHTAGSAGAVQYMAGIQSPISTNVFYGIVIAKEQATDIAILLGSATTIYVVRAKAAVRPVKVVRAR